jgi:hypothetical protein
MKVEVRQEHINKGWPGEPTWCPLYLAIREVLPNILYVNFTHVVYWKFEGEKRSKYRLPGTARKFVRDFDRLKKVEPFIFVLGE